MEMKFPAINLTGESISHLDAALQKEWILTNGLGGYASSTVLGINTRKYHGLLVAALHPSGDRTVCLAKLDEDAIVGKNVYSFNANEFQDKIFPQGYLLLKRFSLSSYPTYFYEAEGFNVTKTIFMPRDKNVVAIIYHIQGGNSAAQFRVYPLLTCRHFHSVIDRHQNLLEIKQESNRCEVELSFVNPKATIVVSSIAGGEFIEKPIWIERIHYREESARGESCKDDLYQPGFFEIQVPPNISRKFAIVTAASENSNESKFTLSAFGSKILNIELALKNELKEQAKHLSEFYRLHSKLDQSEWLSWIVQATNKFVVRGAAEDWSIIAGYHWFGAWGRDTFVSLPGLTLVTGRFDDARRILKFFIKQLNQGIIPNEISGKSEKSSYNTADATLWYINAVLQYIKYTGDILFVRESLWESLTTIIDSHEKGTLFGIHLDSDGLLAHGPRLTWMDAEVNAEAVTPRTGKAVEIQALWYNALKTMQLVAHKVGEESLREHYGYLAENACRSFNAKFWNLERNCLFDVINESDLDTSLRPNQIIAAALDFPIINRDRAEKVVDIAQRMLLTPCGLRSLDKNDPKYKGRYDGDRANRDQAYHNGTVWSWLAGPYTTAYLKAKGYGDYFRGYAETNCILPLLRRQIHEAGLGTVSEIFDGDSPHTPKGCIAQAWSVAEPLRAYVEDIMLIRPLHESEVLLS